MRSYDVFARTVVTVADRFKKEYPEPIRKLETMARKNRSIGRGLFTNNCGADVHAGAEDAWGRKDRAQLEAILARAGAAFSDNAAALHRQ